MNAKILITLFALFSLLLSACGAAATPASVAVAPQAAEVVKPAEVVKEGEKVVEQPVAAEPQVAAQPTAAQLVLEAPRNTQLPLPAPTMLPPIGSVPTPVDNYFNYYGVNPFTDANEDHLSTFSLDVDTASYTVMRRYVMDGNLPPAESVRVEEYVNYFKQDYPNPPEVAFGVYADGAPSPFYSDGSYILRFGVQGYQVPEYQRKSSSLTFVIDVSGSMKMENRLELVKQSLQLLVDRLRPDDYVSIVVYGSTARVVLEPTSGRERDRILNAIYSLQPEGSTNAEAGLSLGYEMAIRAYRSGGTNRVILCSDGVANVGATNPDEILNRVHGYVEEGIYLTTVGFGMGNFNDVLLEQLADKGNGNYAYVDNLDEARSLFIDKLTSTLEVIALNAKVQVDFNPDVVAYYRLIGYENRAVADQDFRNDAVDAGEIGAGHSATAMYAVILRPKAEGRIGTVQLRWEDPQTRQSNEINGNFNTWDLSASFQQASPRYQLAVLVTQTAEILRQSPWTRGLALSQVYNLAVELPFSFPEDPAVGEFVDVLGRASRIGR